MALAIIDLEDADERELRFRVDIGTNRLFTWAIGDAEHLSRVEGFPVMEERTYESPLQELPPRALGRTTIGVPRHLFEGDGARDIQLLSFREQRMGENVGPAVSDALRVRPQLSDLPDLRRPRGFAFATEPPQIEAAAFREEARPLSTAMFLEFLTGIASKILPVVTNLISSPQAGSLLTNLLSGLTAAPAPAAGGQPAAPASPVLGTLAKPENAKLLVELLQQLVSGAAAKAETKSLNGSRRRDGYALGLETEAHLSHAQVAPALMALLPMVMPLLQQVLTPETVKTLIQTVDPTKVLGIVTNGLQDAAKIGLEGQKRHLEHLEKLNPGTGADEILELLKDEAAPLALTLASEPRSKPDYLRVDAVKLSFAEIGVQTVAGRPQACFAADRELRFPLTLETPRPIAQATLHLQVKDPASLRVLVRRSFPIENAVTGRLGVVPVLAQEDVAKLGAGRECLVAATLTWPAKGKRAKRLGTSMTQLVSLVGPLAFDRIEQTDEVIPLNDVELHRAFWHKAWQGSFARDRRRIVFNCKYHFALDSAGTANRQMETLTDLEQQTVSREAGRLKSGLVLNVYVLNKLLGVLPGGRALEEPELAALKTREFGDRFSQAARTQVSFRGRPGDAAALWVYPEVKLQRIILRSADEVNEAGHVVRFGEREVRFPIPVLAHFIGVASQ